MSIIVFGASGNIGSNIRKEALLRGHQVTAVTHSTELPAEPNLTTIHASLADVALAIHQLSELGVMLVGQLMEREAPLA